MTLIYRANISIVVLHPYYKLDYIKLTWGGAEEQAKERAAGNVNARNWQDDALKVVEMTVSNSVTWNNHNPTLWLRTDGEVLQEASKSRARRPILAKQWKYDAFQVYLLRIRSISPNTCGDR